MKFEVSTHTGIGNTSTKVTEIFSAFEIAEKTQSANIQNNTIGLESSEVATNKKYEILKSLHSENSQSFGYDDMQM